ncbi:hypothetical protein NDU88_007931 [Pleurodeles waltl]|uniref:Secreted protein n=1 Tax=Pleurodeles waltl TaxID=8319 RepID=A0AAV7QT36_PLEWA|nr:hypothetical protein NDU88_007931 [Pleurodeles waltl]
MYWTVLAAHSAGVACAEHKQEGSEASPGNGYRVSELCCRSPNPKLQIISLTVVGHPIERRYISTNLPKTGKLKQRETGRVLRAQPAPRTPGAGLFPALRPHTCDADWKCPVPPPRRPPLSSCEHLAWFFCRHSPGSGAADALSMPSAWQKSYRCPL